jgi:hypothetical protein
MFAIQCNVDSVVHGVILLWFLSGLSHFGKSASEERIGIVGFAEKSKMLHILIPKENHRLSVDVILIVDVASNGVTVENQFCSQSIEYFGVT